VFRKALRSSLCPSGVMLTTNTVSSVTRTSPDSASRATPGSGGKQTCSTGAGGAASLHGVDGAGAGGSGGFSGAGFFALSLLGADTGLLGVSAIVGAGRSQNSA